jgi:large subunit ribosomal protein L32
MAVPKKRMSKSQSGQRRAHDAIRKLPATTLCESCGAVKLMHHVCLECGTYRGLSVMAVKSKGGDVAGEAAAEGSDLG